MREMPDKSVDLFVTSPPYNLKNSTGNGMKHNTRSGKWAKAALRFGYSNYDDCMPHEEYVAWQRACLEEMFRLLKMTGQYSTITNGVYKMDCYKTDKI